MAKPRKDDKALKAFLALSEDERFEAIDRVLEDLGIFDGEDLRDDWAEILRARKGVV